jgi:protein-disulfide isomerase
MMTSKIVRTLAAAAAVAAMCAGSTLAQAQAQGITSDQAQQILDELRAIRKNLEARPVQAAAPAPAQPAAPVDDKVSMALPVGGFTVGKEDAPLVLVEYTDYQCPFCQQFHNTSYAQIKTNYIDTGKIRFVSRDFPLGFHENAMRGAIAARCAAEQGKYWELRHTMIVNASQLQPDKIEGYAANVSMDVNKFKTCVAADKFKASIDKDIAEGTAAGINGTPSFVLGRVKDGKLQGVRMVGAMPYSQFDAKIQEMLAQPKG